MMRGGADYHVQETYCPYRVTVPLYMVHVLLVHGTLVLSQHHSGLLCNGMVMAKVLWRVEGSTVIWRGRTSSSQAAPGHPHDPAPPCSFQPTIPLPDSTWIST